MYYVMSLERDEWGNMQYFRRGKYFKSFLSACKLAKKLPDANVMKYGSKIPVFTTNIKLKDIINYDLRTN